MDSSITVIGIGRLGLCTALVFEKSGYNVCGLDKNTDYIDTLNNKSYNSFEPDVSKYLRDSQNFYATTNLIEALYFSDDIFIVVPTPNSGKDKIYDCSILSDLLTDINTLKVKNKNFIICCTVMPGYCRHIAKTLIENCENCSINYNPEFIAQGSIIKDFENPDIVLIGQENQTVGDRIQAIYQTVYKNKNPKYCRMSSTEAEITKISINSFITTKISFANMISDVCDNYGEDVNKDIVLNAVGGDSRIGNKYFKSGYSFGGPCFPRDTHAFAQFLCEHNIAPDMVDATNYYNEYHLSFQLKQLLALDKKRYTFENVCYKENCNVPIIEESAKLKLAYKLAKLGKSVYIHDVEGVVRAVKKEYGDLFTYSVKG